MNTKVARVAGDAILAVRGRPYELQRAPARLVTVVGELASEVGAEPGDEHAVTMTAELSQLFRTKREGVCFVLDTLAVAFPGAPLRVYTVAGTFVDVFAARAQPTLVAAANWRATAAVVSRLYPDVLLVDVGTTTTDIIPVVAGTVVAEGRTDPERLLSGELVYTGALRTPVEAIASHVPIQGRPAGVAAEAFALAGDVHVWRGDLDPADYTVPTPDGRPVTREFVHERLARTVCGDRDLLDSAAIDDIAASLAAAQVERIREALVRVAMRHPAIAAVATTGVGEFLAVAAARRAGLPTLRLAAAFGDDAARCAPAACVALLLEEARP